MIRKYNIGDTFKVKESHHNCYGTIRKGSYITILEAESGCNYYTIQNRKGLIIKGAILR